MRKLLMAMAIPAVVLMSCEEKGKTTDPQHKEEYEVLQEVVGEDSVSAGHEIKEISIEELPEDIVVNLKEDSLLSMLELESVFKITKGEVSYYDIRFVADDHEDVIVSFDDKGNIIQL